MQAITPTLKSLADQDGVFYLVISVDPFVSLNLCPPDRPGLGLLGFLFGLQYYLYTMADRSVLISLAPSIPKPGSMTVTPSTTSPSNQAGSLTVLSTARLWVLGSVIMMLWLAGVSQPSFITHQKLYVLIVRPSTYAAQAFYFLSSSQISNPQKEACNG